MTKKGYQLLRKKGSAPLQAESWLRVYVTLTQADRVRMTDQLLEP